MQNIWDVQTTIEHCDTGNHIFFGPSVVLLVNGISCFDCWESQFCCAEAAYGKTDCNHPF